MIETHNELASLLAKYEATIGYTVTISNPPGRPGSSSIDIFFGDDEKLVAQIPSSAICRHDVEQYLLDRRTLVDACLRSMP
jgi:hypothetical protein